MPRTSRWDSWKEGSHRSWCSCCKGKRLCFPLPISTCLSILNFNQSSNNLMKILYAMQYAQLLISPKYVYLYQYSFSSSSAQRFSLNFWGRTATFLWFVPRCWQHWGSAGHSHFPCCAMITLLPFLPHKKPEIPLKSQLFPMIHIKAQQLQLFTVPCLVIIAHPGYL